MRASASAHAVERGPLLSGAAVLVVVPAGHVGAHMVEHRVTSSPGTPRAARRVAHVRRRSCGVGRRAPCLSAGSFGSAAAMRVIATRECVALIESPRQERRLASPASASASRSVSTASGDERNKCVSAVLYPLARKQ